MDTQANEELWEKRIKNDLEVIREGFKNYYLALHNFMQTENPASTPSFQESESATRALTPA